MGAMSAEKVIELREQAMDSKRRWAAQQARAYMLEHIDDAISVRRLSLLTGVSERTLRYGFQELYGMSPSKYLKAVRMQRVRQALRRAHSSRTTVLREAMRSGFWHLSRFSSEYKNFFGELPSATLRGTM